MNLPKEILLPNPDEIVNIDTSREVTRQVVTVIEELHRDIYNDLKDLIIPSVNGSYDDSGLISRILILENSLSSISSSISDIEGDVTTIQGNITTIQGNITTLNGDVSDKADTTYVDDNTKERWFYFLVPIDLTTGTDVTGRIYIPFAGTITEVYASVSTAPTGSDLICDINLNGSTIWSTQANRVTISASSETGSQTTFDTTAVSANDYLTLDVDQVGSTIAGSKLAVRVRMEKTYA